MAKFFLAVLYSKCSMCGCIEHYDGQKQGYLNMGSYLIGHDVLRTYMHSFLHGKLVSSAKFIVM